jgi:N-acetylglucosamine kinase-like BadF-type ATPase
MVLAVDLGQSGARFQSSDSEFVSKRAKQAHESTLDVLNDLFAEAQEHFGSDFQSDVVALSITGVYGDVGDPKPYGLLASKYFGATSVAVIDDGLAGYFGALGNSDGVALSIGSGTVAIAGRRGSYSHTDGLGHIFGDLGGGFWLGKAALERVLATQEGRDDATFLSEFFESEIKTYESLKSHTDAKAQLLCINAAKTLLEAAEMKNTDAITIRDKGAENLAKTIRAAWTNVGGMPNEGIAIALLGKLAENKGYLEAIRRRTSSLLPQITLVDPQGNHLDGATFIAEHVPEDIDPLLRWWHK